MESKKRKCTEASWIRFIPYRYNLLQRWYHDHETHKDDKTDISQLEKSALEFFYEDCGMFEKTEGSIYVDDGCLCFYNAIHRFMETGSRDDAFDVYYCFIDSFIKEYEKARTMIEMLSNYEKNASTLVMKQRDHYSHSVYVFVLGLAIYHENSCVRESFEEMYKDYAHGAMAFLKYWGLTSLFHDVGYPFEIPFEQIKSYVKPRKNEEDKYPFIAYKCMENYVMFGNVLERCGVDLKETDQKRYFKILMEMGEKDDPGDLSLNMLAAHYIAKRLNSRVYPGQAYNDKEGERYICDTLFSKPARPEDNNMFMDHAYFSSMIIFGKLIELVGIENICGDERDMWMDSLTAIIMHNSLFKFKLRKIIEFDKKGGYIEKKRPLELKEHPLAYLLMLCDELQSWDRAAYGMDSVKETHSFDCEFEFGKEAAITATYLFDGKPIRIDENGKSNVEQGTLRKFFTSGKKVCEKDGKKVEDTIIINPSHLTIQDVEKEEYEAVKPSDCKDCVYYKDINDIVRLDDIRMEGQRDGLLTGVKITKDVRYRNGSFSEMKLINIIDLARSIYEKYSQNNDFCDIPLKKKLSYIELVKNVSRYFDNIGCFYSDEYKPFERKKIFTLEERHLIKKCETERQLDERATMCERGGNVNPLLFEKMNEDSKILSNYVRKNMEEITEKNELDSSYYSLTDNEADEERRVDSMISVFGEKLRIYNMPNVLSYYLVYPEAILKKIENISKSNGGLEGEGIQKATEYFINNVPSLIISRDSKGQIVKVYSYSKGQFYPQLDEEGKRVFYLYDNFRMCKLRERDASTEELHYFYGLEYNSDYPRLEAYISHDHIDVFLKNNELYQKALDETDYFFEQEDDAINVDTIFVKNGIAGCVDLDSCIERNTIEYMSKEGIDYYS